MSEYRKRELEFRRAEALLAQARADEGMLRAELEGKEAACAQDELLDYIKEAKYARNPFGLANAMAGLPDLSWSQSHFRCSKIRCSGWPNLWFSEFEMIFGIWAKWKGSPHLPIVAVFRQEITELPKKILQYYEPEQRKIWMPNQMRSRLGDNFRLLHQAIEDVLNLRMHPGRIPFAITSLFEKNIEKPRNASEDLEIAHERIQ